jgi:hypothetical protein
MTVLQLLVNSVAHTEWLHNLTTQVVIRTSDFQTDVNTNSVFELLHVCKADGLMMADTVEPYHHTSSVL